MSNLQSPPDTLTSSENPAEASVRPRCPAPANIRAEVAAYDAAATIGRSNGARYRLTYRILGQGPPLILIPGISSTYRGYSLILNRLAARFRTIIYDYPGEHPDDHASLGRITHELLADDLFGLIDHLNVGRVFLVGISFGSTITLRALAREPRRFPRTVVQGAFAHRRFTMAERLALRFGRLLPGHVSRLPFYRSVMTWNNRCQFPSVLDDRWEYYLAENGLTPIASLAHRVDMLATLDLRPILPQIPNEILLLQGNEDRIVPRACYDELLAQLPHATGVIMPMIGHQPHYTHAEIFAQAIGDYLLPCAPGGCPNEPR
jgi:pimeloyl-ACP methyl ester carboxylesterase